MTERKPLAAYTLGGWEPALDPAPRERDWMDQSPMEFAYRCLPLAMANQHGWVARNKVPFVAWWTGDNSPQGVLIRYDPAPAGTILRDPPVSIFGQGVLTWHIGAIMRTPPGWNLWVTGAPNAIKDGIAPLTGLVETDWTPTSFTMNWRFTRPGHTVRFEAGEPFCFMMPVPRGAVEGMEPEIRDMADEPDLEARFRHWSAKRDEFHRDIREDPHRPRKRSETWEKDYYQGHDTLHPERKFPEHQTKLRVKPFADKRPRP